MTCSILSLMFQRLGGAAVIVAGIAACGASSLRTPDPARSGPIVFFEVDTTTALFPEERDALRGRARELLEAQGLHVLPDAELDELRRLASEGRARAGGPVCARPPSWASLLEARYGSNRHARLSLWVRGATLTVSEPDSRAPDSSVIPGHEQIWTADSVGTPQSVADWEGVIATLYSGLRPSPAGPMPLIDRHAVPIGLKTPRIELGEAVLSGEWERGQPRREDFEELLPMLDACHDPRWSLGQVALAVGMTGKVERCFMTADAQRPYAEDVGRRDCFCKAWSSARFAPGNTSRRMAVIMGNLRRVGELTAERFGAGWVTFFDAQAPHGYDVVPIVDDMRLELAACAKTHPNRRLKPGYETRAPTRIDIDGSGRVTGVRIDLDEAPDLARCVADVIKHTQFPCTDSGKPIRIEATYAVVGGERRSTR